jgi:hypothetical protein
MRLSFASSKCAFISAAKANGIKIATKTRVF